MGFLKYAFSLTTLTIFVALFAIILEGFKSAKELQRITNILTHLISLEGNKNIDVSQKPKIAVGYGSCFDLYIQATKFLNYTEKISHADFEYDGNFNTMDNLLQNFKYYFLRGAAAEYDYNSVIDNDYLTIIF